MLISKANLLRECARLLEKKRTTIAGIAAVERFVTSAVAEACHGDGSALFGRLLEAGGLLPQDLIAAVPRAEYAGPPAEAQAERLRPFLRAQLFISLMAELEDMLVEVARAILLCFPGKLVVKQVAVSTVIEAHREGEVLDSLVDVELSALFYAGPAKLRTRLEEVLSAPKLFVADWPQYTEMRARRDIALHAGWKRNRIYLEKAGASQVPEDSVSLYPTDAYFSESCALGFRLVAKLQEHILLKFKHCSPGHVFRNMWDQSPLSRVMPFEEAWIGDDPPAPTEKALQWYWSSTERLLWEFFYHIYDGATSVDFVRISQRWPGNGARVVREWLNAPFYL